MSSSVASLKCEISGEPIKKSDQAPKDLCSPEFLMGPKNWSNVLSYQSIVTQNSVVIQPRVTSRIISFEVME